jgi:hypothetical protein
MDLIIRLIFDLIRGFQEKDVESRKKAAEEKKARQRGETNEPASASMSLDEWLKGSSAPMATPEAPPAPTEPAAGKQEMGLNEWLGSFDETPAPQVNKPKKKKAQKKKQKKKVSYAQYEEAQAPREFKSSIPDGGLSRDSSGLNLSELKPVHKEAYDLEIEKKVFVLPGRTALEQMIWAQTILGPCKANRRQTARF